MYMMIVNIPVKADEHDKFIEVTEENAKHTRKEEGAISFDLYQQADNPNEFILIEIYKNEEASKAHQESDHFKKWIEVAPPLMDGSPSAKIYQKPVRNG